MSDEPEAHPQADGQPAPDPAEPVVVAPSLFEDEVAAGDEAGAPPRRHWRRGVASCLVVLVVLAVVGVGGTLAVFAGMDKVRGLFQGPEDYDGAGSGSVLVEIQQGDTSAVIGRRLKKAGVVKSVEAFTEAAAADDKSRSIQVGFYELREQMAAEKALGVLVDPDNLVQASVTIPEGLRVADTVQRLADKTDITKRAFDRVLADPAKIGLPDYADGNPEGYLFPATYAFPPDATATAVLSAMVDRWKQAAQDADLTAAAKRLGYTPAELMVVASLVEAEANRDQDRGKVARVIYNRLETDATGGLLQIDATVNYALGRDLGLGLTAKDLQVDSPYNTRRFPGLPPGPIESPGDKAIEAAANPPAGPWVYYVTVDLDSGETRFTDDYDQFLTWKNVDLARFCASSDRC